MTISGAWRSYGPPPSLKLKGRQALAGGHSLLKPGFGKWGQRLCPPLKNLPYFPTEKWPGMVNGVRVKGPPLGKFSVGLAGQSSLNLFFGVLLQASDVFVTKLILQRTVMEDEAWGYLLAALT